MQALIHAGAFEIEADGFGHAPAQPLLHRHRKWPVWQDGRAPTGLPGQHPVEECSEERCVVLEDGDDPRGVGAGLVFVHQDVVDGAAERRRLGLTCFARQPHDLLETGPQGRKVGIRPRRAPHGLALGGRPRPGGDEIGGNRIRVEPDPPHLAQVRGLPWVQRRGLRLGRSEIGGGPRMSQHFMQQHAKIRDLLGPGASAARGHHDGHVPVQYADGLLD
jgi:hypothetical protein